MRQLIESLCGPECHGRRPGTPGGTAARRLVRDAFRAVGLDPVEQPVPACNGANVLARSLRLTSEAVLTEILDAWFGGVVSSEPGDVANVARVRELERRG